MHSEQASIKFARILPDLNLVEKNSGINAMYFKIPHKNLSQLTCQQDMKFLKQISKIWQSSSDCNK